MDESFFIKKYTELFVIFPNAYNFAFVKTKNQK